VDEIIILAQKYSQRCTEDLSSVPLFEMEAHPLKNVEKAVIRLQVMLSAL
jgi:hypothetical protein